MCWLDTPTAVDGPVDLGIWVSSQYKKSLSMYMDSHYKEKNGRETCYFSEWVSLYQQEGPFILRRFSDAML